MSTNIIHKRSAVQNKEPLLSSLQFGEIAINTYDGKIFFKSDDGTGEILNTVIQVTEDNLLVNTTNLNYSSESALSAVIADLDEAIKALEDENHISTVTHDTTLSGLGTVASPLSVNYSTLDQRYLQVESDTLQTVTDRGASSTNRITVPSIELGDHSASQGAILSWNDTDGTVDLAYDGVTLQVGQEQHIYGKAVGSISNGQPVMFAGAQGDHILFTRADVNVEGFNPKWIIGLATTSMLNNEYGYITAFGNVRSVDTSAYAEGTILYLDTSSPGILTETPPSAPNHTITMAAVTRSHQEEGSLFVRPSWSLDLHELCDVDLTHGNIGDKNLLQYNTSTDTWSDTSTPTVDYMDFRGSETTPYAEGRLYYHDEYKALSYRTDIPDVSLQIGLEEWVRVYNNTGSTIANGTPVYITGAFGETPTVAPSDATTELHSHCIGLATHDIPNNTSGVVTTRGLVSGIDTSSLTAGARVHVSPTGMLQNDAPTYPYYPTDIGTCVVSDATNGYLYVHVQEHAFEQLRVTGNQHVDGSLTVDGDLIVNGTQSLVSQNNLAIADSFVYLNSGDNIGEAGTTFTGSGLDDAYFAGYYEGPTTTTYYVRIDGVGTGTGGVDTFEWSKDNFATTEATGVDITGDKQELEYDLGIRFYATTGHTAGDTWSGTAAPINTDTGWATNRNTGTTGVGYTHMGVFFDVSDEKFKFFDQYLPEPTGTIDIGDASFNLGTVVAANFEGLASNASNLNGQQPSYYLNYNNFTNTPDINNPSITVEGDSGISGTGTFTLNAATGDTITLTNSDKGSSQNIFKSFSVSGQNTVFADSNNEDLELVAGTNVTITTDDTNKQIVITSTDTNDNDNDYLTGLAFNTSNGVLTATIQNQSDVTVDLDDRYVLITDNPSETTSTSISTTNQTVVDSFDSNTYRTAKYLVQVSYGTDFHATEMLLVHNDTATYLTEYAITSTGPVLATFDSRVSNGDVELLCTPSNAGSTVKVHRLNITV